MSIEIGYAPGAPAAAPVPSSSAVGVGPEVPSSSTVAVGPEVPPIDDGLEHPATHIPRKPALSPSRASDFKTCPLLYRYRAIDRLPEPPSKPAVRGTLVHATLEDLFTRPAAERTLASAIDRLAPLWEQLLASRPELVDLVAEEDLGEWFEAANALLHTYFGLEDPTRLEPAACELRVEVDLPDGVPLRGFIDRLDVSADGRIRVVDYKTGRSPGESYTTDVLFQLKFYALMLFRLRGVIPARLRLVYLGDNQLLEYSPDSDELVAFERQVVALWRAVERATETRNFPARTSRLCDWCSFQALCPEFGGTVPPFPEPVAVAESAGEGVMTDAEPDPVATSR
jgi:putative RecB family exonuclease